MNTSAATRFFLPPARGRFTAAARQPGGSAPRAAVTPPPVHVPAPINAGPSAVETSVVLAGCVLLAGSALFASLMASAVFGKQQARVDAQVASVEARMAQVESRVNRAAIESEAALLRLRSEWAHVRNPPSSFTQAQDAFRAARYAEAEAAYSRYLVEFPSGALADIALQNAGLAAAMRGNCALAESRFALLRKRHPYSEAAQKGPETAAACRTARRQNAAAKR